MITDEETVKLKRLLTKQKNDLRIVMEMISDLNDNRIEIRRDIAWLEQMLGNE